VQQAPTLYVDGDDLVRDVTGYPPDTQWHKDALADWVHAALYLTIATADVQGKTILWVGGIKEKWFESRPIKGIAIIPDGKKIWARLEKKGKGDRVFPTTEVEAIESSAHLRQIAEAMGLPIIDGEFANRFFGLAEEQE
jgi:hypothetical protein